MRRRVTPAGDIIVTLLTPQGKIKAIARGGVRGPQASRLNLFHHVGVQLYQTPQSDLATVKQSILEGALPHLCEPERHPYAHLISELADALFQEGEFSEQVFDLYAGSLRGVSRHADPEWVALVMSYKLLSLAGFAPRTRHCARCGAADPAHPRSVGRTTAVRRLLESAAAPRRAPRISARGAPAQRARPDGRPAAAGSAPRRVAGAGAVRHGADRPGAELAGACGRRGDGEQSNGQRRIRKHLVKQHSGRVGPRLKQGRLWA